MERDKPPKQGPLWLSVLSVAVIVAAVIVTLAATQRLKFNGPGSAAPNAMSSAHLISTEATASLRNLRDASFSPDGLHIAIIGDLSPCHQMNPGLPRCGHGIAVYNTQTSTLTRMLPVESMLGVTIPPDANTPLNESDGYVNLSGLGWSPDSNWFAAVYTVFDTAAPTSPDDISDSGLLLVNPETDATQIIRGDSGYFGPLGGRSASHPIWDIKASYQTLGFTPQPGIVFAWGNNGLPITTQPVAASLSELPANAGPRYPVGQPDGLAPFTIWQPGVVIGPESSPIGGGRSEFVTTFPSWSADGAHAGLLSVGASIPTPSSAESHSSAGYGLAGPNLSAPAVLPAIPTRDVALAHVQEDVGAFGWAEVAWNPAGTMLASISCFARSGSRVEVRDTASGAVIGSAQLNLQANDPGCRDATASNLKLAWAPDGSQVLVSDTAAASITLWSIDKV